jgi:cytoskeleton protein RodZ
MPDSDSKDLGQADAGATPNLGERLRQAREAQGLSLDDVSAELRIEPRSLRALEECRLEALGAPVFAKGYIKQYGALVGLDPKELIAEFERQGGLKPIEVEPSKTIKLHDDRQITVWIFAAVVLLALGAYVVYWWLGQAA